MGIVLFQQSCKLLVVVPSGLVPGGGMMQAEPEQTRWRRFGSTVIVCDHVKGMLPLGPSYFLGTS